MSLPISGWKNKNGTSQRTCSCGSWQKHWGKQVMKAWPSQCYVSGCLNRPTVGAHLINSQVSGERIAPLCDSCNKRTDTFSLKGGGTLADAKQD